MDECRYVGIDLVEFNEMMDVISVKNDLLRREAPNVAKDSVSLL